MRASKWALIIIQAFVMSACRKTPTPIINIKTYTIEVDYKLTPVSIPFSIDYADGGKLTAENTAQWIHDIIVEDNNVNLVVDENDTDRLRSAIITLKYPGAESVVVHISQSYAISKVVLTPSSADFDYLGGSGSFFYTVENKRDGVEVTIDSDNQWIADVAKTENGVSYIVAENNTGAQRTGKVVVSYGHYAQAEYIITQKWSASTITLLPSSAEFDYQGGFGSFSFKIDNPRSNEETSVKSNCTWITDVTKTDNVVSFRVAENNAGMHRIGKIIVSYGSYVQSEYIVSQKWAAPTIQLTTSSAEFNYSGGTGTFSFMVSNPRSDAELVVNSNCSWVTDIKKTENAVSFSVSENNDGSHRTGKIIVSYGSYTQSEFIINQKWAAPVIVLAPSSAEFEYFGGTGAVNVDINNPRHGATLIFNNQYDWITNVVQTTNEIRYSVSVNYSGIQRKKVVTIDYGNYVSTNFSIVQKGHPITSIALNKTSINLLVGSTDNIKVVSVSPEDSELFWTSSDSTVVAVDSNGLIRAIKVGGCDITVQSSSGGEIAICTVRVNNIEGGNEGMGEIIWK